MFKKLSLGLFVGLAFTGQTFAKTYNNAPYKGGGEDVFVSASIGTASHTFGNDENSEALKANEISYGLDLDYRISKYFSLGLGYVNFGEAEQLSEVDTVGDVTEAYSLMTAGSGVTAHLTWHTDTRDGPWYFFMRFGKIQWDVELISEVNVTGGATFFERETVTIDGSDSFTSFGGGYYFTDQIRVGLKMNYFNMSYDLVDPEDNTSESLRNGFDQTALTVTYSF